MSQENLFKTYRRFKPAWKAFTVYALGWLLLWFGPRFNPDTALPEAVWQLLGTLFLAFILIKRYTNEYRVSQDTLSAATSFPRQKETSVNISDIRRIDPRRGLTQRMLGVAHVYIYVEGRDEPALKLFGVPEPDDFKRLLMDLGASDTVVTGAWRK